MKNLKETIIDLRQSCINYGARKWQLRYLERCRKEIRKKIFRKVRRGFTFFFQLEVYIVQALIYLFFRSLRLWNVYCHYEASWYEGESESRFYREKFYRDAAKFFKWLYRAPINTVKRFYLKRKLWRTDANYRAEWLKENEYYYECIEDLKWTAKFDYHYRKRFRWLIKTSAKRPVSFNEFFKPDENPYDEDMRDYLERKRDKMKSSIIEENIVSEQTEEEKKDNEFKV